jgi:ABC-2 type transport system ATP-binding protein
MKAISTYNLTKQFPRTAGYRDLIPFRKKQWVMAAENISLEVNEGEFFGLLGPNGAGKTTLIKMLSCLVIPTSGTAQVFGFDTVKKESQVKKLIGLVSAEERSFYWRLTGRENLRFYAALYHIPGQQARKRIDDLLKLVELEDKADIRFQNYSTGMKQKLAIARGLLSEPRILFVDEPTRSLDPVSAQAVRRFFKERIAGEGKTVILATHNLDEAEQLCDRLAIIAQGRVKALGSVKQLRSVFQKQEKCELQVKNLSETVLLQLGNIDGVIDCRPATKTNGVQSIELRISDRAVVLPHLMNTMVKNSVEVCDCRLTELPLDEIFLYALRSDN